MIDHLSAFELKAIVHKKNGLSGGVVPLQIEHREKERSMNSAFGSKHLGYCVECGGSIIGILFKCFQCIPDYKVCGLCVSYGSHPQHVVVRLSEPNVIDFSLHIVKFILNQFFLLFIDER